MDLREADLLGADVRDHWYYSSKAKAMMRMLSNVKPERIVDVGAGSGFFSRHILENSDAKEAWCIDVAYDVEGDVEEGGGIIHYRRSADTVDADLMLFMDVLEHVEDDVGLLRDYAGKAANGTVFLITVPAFQVLWSEHDEFLGHKRRYTISQLEGVVRKAGLDVRCGAYYFGLVLPIAAITRLVGAAPNRNAPRSQLGKHFTVVNGLLKLLCYLELPLISFNRVGGLSVFCLTEKRNPRT